MAISLACPQCGRTLRVDEKFAGKTGRCPQCGATTRIPAASGGVRQPSAPQSTPEDPYALADPEPRLPPRAPEPDSGVVPKRIKPKSAKASAAQVSTKSNAKQLTSWGGGFFVALVALRIVMAVVRGNAGNKAPQPALPPPIPPVVVAAAPAEPPPFSPRGEGTLIKPGVRFFEAKASGPPNVATARMTIWVYLPEGAHEDHSLPCVVVAPAGSIIITGMDLGDGDRAEHLPYVPAGYAVLSYSLDGYLERGPNTTDAQVAQAAAQFIAARAGLSNAKTAIDWMLKNFAEVDPERLYTAGHSSAGTMALLLAQNDRRIKACAAYSPRSNTEGNFNAAQIAALRTVIPGLDQIFTTYNPSKHVGDMSCPVLLFQARDDSVVPVSETEAFAQALKSASKDVTVALVAAGDHYEPMVNEGIPRAIAFFAEHGSRAQAR
jgi:dienelactone hydrolase